MPMTQAAHFALFAAAACLIAPACFASEVEAVNAPVSVASHGLFSSWFSTRTIKADAPVVEAISESDVIDTSAAPSGSRASDLVVGALGLLGISYRFGGNTPAS